MTETNFEGSVNPFDLTFRHNGVTYSIDVRTDNVTFKVSCVQVIDTGSRFYAGSYEYTLASIHLAKKYKRLLQI